MYKGTTFHEWFQDAWVGILVCLFFALLVFFAGYLPDFYHAEDFLLFRLAETRTFSSAVEQFFAENGRIFEAAYWTGLYKVLGYQPAQQRLVSLFLNLIAASLGSWAFFRSSANLRNVLFASGFIVFGFLNPFTINWAFTLSGDNSRIASVLLFLTLICSQNWFLNGYRFRWLILALFLFAIAVFTYESIALLFPAVAIVVVYMAGSELFKTTKLKTQLLSATLLSLLIPLLPFFLYSHLGIESHPAIRLGGGVGSIVERVGASLIYGVRLLLASGAALAALGKFPAYLPFGISLLVLVAAFLTSVLFVRRVAVDGWPYLLVIAAVWLMLASVYVYSLAYVDGPVYVRFFTISVYGFLLLAFVAYSFGNRMLRGLLLTLLALSAIAGLAEFSTTSKQIRGTEFRAEFDYLSLLTAVPRVGQNTTFIFVNSHLGTDAWRSCSLALQMMYDIDTIRCLYASRDGSIHFVRGDNWLNSYEGGYVYIDKFIILQTDADGEWLILSELNQNSPVSIEWQSTAPISTDFTAIKKGGLETRMIAKLTERSSFAPAGLHE